MAILRAKKTKKQSLSFFWICVLVLGLFAMLHPIYEVVESLYASMYQFKMDYIGLNSIYVVLPYLALISIFVYRQQRRASISDYFILLLTLFYFLPGNILYVYGNWSNTFYIFQLLSYLSLSIVNELVPNIQFSSNFTPIQRKEILPIVCFFIPISIVVIVTYYNGFRINLNLNEVYDLRQEWSNTDMPNIFNYYIPFAARITPVLLVITLKQRRVLLSIILILSQLVSFSFGGMKYTLFALILGILFHFFGKKIDAGKIVLYFSAFVAICLIECLLVKDQVPLLTSYVLRRTSFVPNQIGEGFFSFAQSHEYLYYSESLLKRFLHYPYSEAFPHVIADYAFGLPQMGANTGLFAEGFSQIGWFVIPVYSILYVVIFRLYDACCRSFKGTSLSHIPLISVLLYSSTFIDGAFFSVLLTQGGILTALTLYILSRNLYAKKSSL